MLFNMVADSLFMPAKLSIFREISHGNETFSRNFLEVSGFLLTFAIAKYVERSRSRGGERRPSHHSGHFLCSFDTFEDT